jgi:murein DD-endopeptidase MepM/ murein hydrolase activator NlpD
LGLAAAGAVGAGVGAALGGFIGGLLIPVAGGFIGATAGGIGGDILFRSIYESLVSKTKTDERLKELAGNNDKSKTKPPAKPIMPSEEQKAYFGVDPVVTGRFGEKRGDRYHGGTDIAAPSGTPLVAVTDAIIVDYGDLSRSDAKAGDPNGWGNFIVYKDANGYFHLYGHLSSIVKKSGRVKRGEKIATVGNTGRSSGPHLHWELGTGWNGSMMEGKSDPLSYYSVMAPFRLSGGKQKANLAPPNRNVASGLGDMTDYEQGGVGEIALLPIVEQVETMSKSPSGGGGVIVLNSNAPSRFAPALIG